MQKYIRRRFSTAFALATVFFGVFLGLLFTFSYCLNLVMPKSETTGAGTSSTRSLPIYSVETEEKKIAISFDCAWGVDYTDKLLDIMDKRRKMHFFCRRILGQKAPRLRKKDCGRRARNRHA